MGAGPAVYNTTYGAQGLSFCTDVTGNNFTDDCLASYGSTGPLDPQIPRIAAAAAYPGGNFLQAATAAGEPEPSVGAVMTYLPPGATYPSAQYPDGSWVLASNLAFNLVCLPGNAGYVYANWTVPDGTGGFTVTADHYWCDGSQSTISVAEVAPQGVESFKVFADESLPAASQPAFGIDDVSIDFSPYGPSPQMQGVGTNPSAAPTTCSCGDPVNTATGSFDETATVAAVPGRGVPLDLTRSYSSLLASTAGSLGYGWTNSYAMSLTTDTSGTVTITQENASAIVFTATGAGQYTPAAGVRGTLVQNTDGTYTFTRRPSQLEFTFSSTGQLLSERDRNGDTTTLSYTNGVLSTVTDPAGRSLTFSYTGARLTSVSDPMGRQTQFGYDTNGNLTAVTDAMQRVWHYGYDTNHQLTTITDPRGGQTINVYDASGRVTRQTDPSGQVTTWDYTGDPTTGAGGTTVMIDGHGNKTFFQYESMELASRTDGYGSPTAATTSYLYDAATDNVKQITDPSGKTVDSFYDADGNLTETIDQLNNETSYTYDTLDDRTSTTTPAGELYTATYDSAGNLTSTTDAMSETTTFAHADTAHPGQVTSVTDPDGRVITYSYTPAGDRASMTVTPRATASETTAWAYDADSETTCLAPPAAHAAAIVCPSAGAPSVSGTITTAYDADGEPTSSTDQLGHTATVSYDADGNVTTTVDATGNITTTSYDADNRPVSHTSGTTTAEASTTHYAYDIPVGTAPCTAAVTGTTYCTSSSDANSHTTIDYYSARDQLLATERPDAQVTTYSYDQVGNRITRTDPDRHTSHISFDADNRLTGITYSDGITPPVTYTYDADSRRTSMTDGTGTSSYHYDADSRLTSTTDGAGHTTGYSYDGAGDTTTVTYPDGNTVTRTYDGARRLTGLTDWLGHTTNYGYDADGNLDSTGQPNGDTTRTSYNSADQLTATSLTAANGSVLASLTYGRNSTGLLSSETDTGALSSTKNYSYDAKIQLTSTGSDNYSYDPAGNPTGFGASSQTFAANDELLSATTTTGTGTGTGSTTFGYDPNGNRVDSHDNATAARYTYDQADRLVNSRSGPYFTPLALSRIADTTTGSGLSGAGQALTAGATFTAQVTGAGGVPTTGATAVVLRLTEKNATAATTLTAYPAGAARPATSTLVTNTSLLVASRPRTTEITLPIGTNGQISVYNSTGTTNVALDVAGYYTATPPSQSAPGGDSFTPTPPTRIVDTRSTSGNSYAGDTLAANGGTLTAPIAGRNGIPTTATAVQVAVTAVNNTASGSLSVYATGSAPPTNPSVYTLANQITTEQLTVPLGGTPGSLTIGNNSTAATDLTVDVVGYFSTTSGGGYHALTPTRIVDTRSNSGQPDSGQHLTAGGTLTVQAAGTAGVPATATAVAFTLTAPTGSSSPTSLSAYPTGTTPPTTTALSYDNELLNVSSSNDVPSSEVTVALGSNGAFTLANTSGTTDVTVDILGYYTNPHVTAAYNGDGLRTTTTTSDGTTHYDWDTSTSQLLSDGTADYIYGPTGTVTEQLPAGSTTGTPNYYFTDQLGSTRALTDATGNITATYSYNAYGTTTAHTGTATTPVQYAGGYHDPDTNLYYLVNRYYDPSTGTFLTRDPYEATTGAPYTYVNGDPINGTDPLGLCPSWLCGFAHVVGHALSGAYDWGVTHLDPAYYALIAYGNEWQAAEHNCSLWTVAKYGLEGTIDLAATALTATGAGEGIAGLLDTTAAEGADAAATTGLRDAAESCLNSFTADTPVLMADGKREPIADVKVGDKVLATDPETGRTEARPVTALIRHSGKHAMVDLTLSDGSTVKTTDHHPFWDASTRTFTDAIELRVGDQVLRDHGRTLTISAKHVYDRNLTAYNLQIDGIHTYYAGTTPVLVHNSCGPGSEFEVKTRANPGSDGGISHHLIEKVDGETVSVTHQVEVDGEIVHQHQRYVGVSGDQRYFPSEWSQFPDINFFGGW